MRHRGELAYRAIEQVGRVHFQPVGLLLRKRIARTCLQGYSLIGHHGKLIRIYRNDVWRNDIDAQTGRVVHLVYLRNGVRSVKGNADIVQADTIQEIDRHHDGHRIDIIHGMVDNAGVEIGRTTCR